MANKIANFANTHEIRATMRMCPQAVNKNWTDFKNVKLNFFEIGKFLNDLGNFFACLFLKLWFD